MDKWLEYIKHKHLSKTPIDKIQPHSKKDFGLWLKNSPNEDSNYKGDCSPDQIHNNISEIKQVYIQLAVHDRYISDSQIPQIDQLKLQQDANPRRDILDEQEYEKL